MVGPAGARPIRVSHSVTNCLNLGGSRHQPKMAGIHFLIIERSQKCRIVEWWDRCWPQLPTEGKYLDSDEIAEMRSPRARSNARLLSKFYHCTLRVLPLHPNWC